MLLSDVEGYVRQDLFDTGATRWSNSDIDRAIDKAVDRYTAYSPNIVFVDMQMQPYQRTYPYPQSWNFAYPVLWIEKILSTRSRCTVRNTFRRQLYLFLPRLQARVLALASTST